MTILEVDLLSTLKDLQEVAMAMTTPPSDSETKRFKRAIKWSKREIELAEKSA